MCSLPWRVSSWKQACPSRSHMPPGESSLARPRGHSALPPAALCREPRPGRLWLLFLFFLQGPCPSLATSGVSSPYSSGPTSESVDPWGRNRLENRGAWQEAGGPSAPSGFGAFFMGIAI